MTRDDILSLFKSEDYEKAVIEIKKGLKEKPDDGELTYYLFLAENRDYANISINDIVGESMFNRAMDLSNRRLKNEFEAEYNFYRDLNEYFRRIFCYANRGNINKFIISLKASNPPYILPSDIDEFISNLDYVVTSGIAPKIVDMNLISLNMLYIENQSEEVLEVLKQLIEKAKMINSDLSPYEIIKTKNKLIDKAIIIRDGKKVEIPKEEPEKENNEETNDNNEDKYQNKNKVLLVLGLILLISPFCLAGLMLLVVYSASNNKNK